MRNKVIIDGKEYEVEDEQMLEYEVDFNFPDEKDAIRELTEVRNVLESCIKKLHEAKFCSPEVAGPAAQSTELTLRKEIAFLTKVLEILKGNS